MEHLYVLLLMYLLRFEMPSCLLQIAVRLENEHIGNTDQYRVTREVPLPYSFQEAEDSDASERSSKKSWVQRLRQAESTRSVHLTEVERDGRMPWKTSNQEERV